MVQERVVAIHQPNYFPWLGYADKILRSDVFVFLDTVQYQRRNYTNRTQVRIGDRAHWLTVPVSGGYRDAISEIQVDNSTNWQRKHLLTLQRNYGKNDYFSEIWPSVKDLLLREWTKLSDLNMCIGHWYGEVLNCCTEFVAASDLALPPDLGSSSLLAEIARRVSATVYLSGEGGKRYIDLASFDSVSVSLQWQEFKQREYPQFGQEMMFGLSALDCLFNCGAAGTGKLLAGESV